MENKEDSGKAENLFKNFGKKLDEFMAEVNDAGTRLNKEVESRYEELKDSAEKLKKEVKNKERWKEVEDSLKKAGDELNRAVKAAFTKREEKK